jgi:hypothetical protein
MHRKDRDEHEHERKTIGIKPRDLQTQPYSSCTSTYAKQRVQCSCNFKQAKRGLRHFLNKAQVPGYESEQCNPGTGPEMPRHVLLHCPHEDERRIVLREAQGPPIEYSLGSTSGKQVEDPFREDHPVSVSGLITL